MSSKNTSKSVTSSHRSGGLRRIVFALRVGFAGLLFASLVSGNVILVIPFVIVGIASIVMSELVRKGE